jgi:hypothetical protein
MNSPTKAQIQAFKTKMDAQLVQAIEEAIEEAPPAEKPATPSSSTTRTSTQNSHGQNEANDCLACDALYRSVYGIPEEDEEA